ASSTAGSTIAAIVTTITALARTLGMRVTVEGVETAEQVTLFAEFGCDQMQGYFLGHPLPAGNVAAAILRDFCQREQIGHAPAVPAHERAIPSAGCVLT